jgi:hypothetical protein
MARGKNQTQQKDGKHRKETKEEKILRLQSQQEARDVSLPHSHDESRVGDSRVLQVAVTWIPHSWPKQYCT